MEQKQVQSYIEHFKIGQLYKIYYPKGGNDDFYMHSLFEVPIIHISLLHLKDAPSLRNLDEVMVLEVKLLQKEITKDANFIAVRVFLSGRKHKEKHPDQPLIGWVLFGENNIHCIRWWEKMETNKEEKPKFFTAID